MARDAYHCRYCGCPVIHEAAFVEYERLVGQENFRARETNAQRHGLHLALSAALDHVDPHNTGGRTDADNLVTRC